MSDAIINRLADDKDFISMLQTILEQIPPNTDKQIIHALQGLLRNLLIPDTLKDELGVPAMKAFDRLKVLKPEIGGQVIGPTVGGAVVALKHTVKNNGVL